MRTLFLVLLLGLVPLLGMTDPVSAADSLVFRVGKVVTMDQEDRVINNAVVVVEDGKIAVIGRARDIEIPAGVTVVERPELWLVPGLVECHNHTGGGSSDLHDYIYLTNPGLRTLESIIPDNPEMERARAGGVTTILTIPGSGNNMSGFGTILKTAGGSSVEDAVLKSPGSLKIAQAGNPERYFYGVGRSFMNFNTRQTLRKARDYHLARTAWEQGELKEEPPKDLHWEEFRPLFRRETVASIHTQIYQVLMTTVKMVAGEFGIRTVLDHSTFDAWKVAPLVLEDETIYTINGPRQIHYDRTQRRIMGNAARWWQGGIRKLGINTDAPVVPQEELFYQATMACYYGWTPYEALKGVTRIPAEALMMDHRLGSIRVGLDADFCLWTGDPIDPRSSCEMAVIDGKITYDASKKRVF
ncbi:MAG: amidohydrolase family protein [Planctomycetota bacterium]|nr:amidohydrolase family protein [Planctomycetota bacterium]